MPQTHTRPVDALTEAIEFLRQLRARAAAHTLKGDPRALQRLRAIQSLLDDYERDWFARSSSVATDSPYHTQVGPGGIRSFGPAGR